MAVICQCSADWLQGLISGLVVQASHTYNKASAQAGQGFDNLSQQAGQTFDNAANQAQRTYNETAPQVNRAVNDATNQAGRAYDQVCFPLSALCRAWQGLTMDQVSSAEITTARMQIFLRSRHLSSSTGVVNTAAQQQLGRRLYCPQVMFSE